MTFFGFFFGTLVSLVIPGWLILRKAGIKLPPFLSLLVIFFVSSTLIFQVSFFSVLLNASQALWIYFFAALAAGTVFLRSIRIGDLLSPLIDEIEPVFKNRVSLLLFLVVWGYFVSNSERFDGVFAGWDAVVSWNRWALDWFQGRFPAGTYHYPQLIPALWGAIYRFSGHEYQFLVLFIIPTIVFLFFLHLTALGARSSGKHAIFLLFQFFFIKKYFGAHLFDGYVDVVIVILAALAFLILEEARNLARALQFEESSKMLLLAALIASCAALVKQAGFFVLALTFLEATILNASFPQRNRRFASIFLIPLILVAPYYAYAEFLIRSGINASEVSWVTQDIYDRKSPVLRIYDSILTMGWPSALFLAHGIWMVTQKGWKRRMSAFTLLLFLIWAAFFCYDFRNLSVGFAACSYSYGSIFGEGLLSRFAGLALKLKNSPLRRASVMWAFAILIPVLFLVQKNNPESKLDLHHRKLKLKTHLSPCISDFLYSNWVEKCSTFQSDYPVYGYLPDFERLFKSINLRASTVENAGKLKLALESTGTNCFVIPKKIPEILEQTLRESSDRNKIKQVFTSGDLRFYESMPD